MKNGNVWVVVGLALLVVAIWVFQDRQNIKYMECRQAGNTVAECSAGAGGAAAAPTKAAIDRSGDLMVTEAVEYQAGLTEERITPQLIKDIEALVVKDMRERWEERAFTEGRDPTRAQFSATSMRLSEGGSRVMVTELHVATRIPETVPAMKMAWWIQDSSFKRVFCVDANGREINVRRGQCGAQIARTFGYDNWLLD